MTTMQTYQIRQYEGNGSLHGFGSGRDLAPGEIAEKMFGDQYDSANAFLYLFRRFGYPTAG